MAGLVCAKRPNAFNRRIVFDSYSAKDCSAADAICEYPDKNFLNDPALTQIRLTGCGAEDARRPIDYVLLGIGGNDIGAAALIAQVALRDDTLDSVALRYLFTRHLGETENGRIASVRLRYLANKYHHLSQAFATLLPIRADGLTDPQSRVLLLGYPLADSSENGVVCGADAATSDQADKSMDGLNMFGAFLDSALGSPDKTGIVADVHRALCDLDLARAGWLKGSLDPDGAKSRLEDTVEIDLRAVGGRLSRGRDSPLELCRRFRRDLDASRLLRDLGTEPSAARTLRRRPASRKRSRCRSFHRRAARVRRSPTTSPSSGPTPHERVGCAASTTPISAPTGRSRWRT